MRPGPIAANVRLDVVCRVTGVATRIRLCAIAKDEGAYLADWVFHHLHVGFDGIEVWVNGTRDHSVAILTAIRAEHPQVAFRVVDDLLERTLRRSRNFQHVAYAKLAARARRAASPTPPSSTSMSTGRLPTACRRSTSSCPRTSTPMWCPFRGASTCLTRIVHRFVTPSSSRRRCSSTPM